MQKMHNLMWRGLGRQARAMNTEPLGRVNTKIPLWVLWNNCRH